ncbi:MAG: hypothetical protein QNK31_04515 [Porticoccus sp.]|nr:hypothetical protein [Porticoccus sp.]
MRTPENTSSSFKIRSEADDVFLGSLTPCDRDTLFKCSQKNFPIALNLHFPKNINHDYPHLLTREISIYAHKLGERKALKTWLRGRPLKSLSAAEITEVTFLAATHFQMDEGNHSEYGFECTVSDITENNLALMKGLCFTTLRLNVDVSFAPKNTAILSALNLIEQYKFQECHYRLYTEGARWSSLCGWVNYLVKSHPAIIEIMGKGKDENNAVTLNQMTEKMSQYAYVLIGDRFFVQNNHPLALLKQQGKLQYTPPWGASHPNIKDWIGLGMGAIGRIGGAFYQNLRNEVEYVADLSEGRLPICCSGQHSNKNSQQQWKLVEQLICLHKISMPPHKSRHPAAKKTEEILAISCKNGWMTKQGSDFIMQSQGLNHMHEICTALQLS